MDLEKKLTPSILIAFAVETLTATWFLKIPGWAPLFSILYFASGIAIAGMLLYFPAIHLPSPGLKPWKSPVNQRRLVVTGLIALALYSWCLYWFDEIPIDISNADMLPIIKVMGERFISGQHSHIYDPIPAIWHGALPIYLPAMWLPYVPAIALGIDMRWIAIAGLLFAFGTFVFLYRTSGSTLYRTSGDLPQTAPSARSSQTRGTFFLGVLAFLLFWWVVADNTAGVVSVSEEGVVIGYYVLLVLALLSGKPWLTGIAMSLCMLSRYALVGWIPAYLLYLALERRWRHLSVITLTGILCFTLLFLVPVGWATFMRLIHLPGDYVAFADRVWNDSPDVFSTAPGLASFFGRKGVAILHGLLITFSFTIPLLFTILAYRRTRSRSQNSDAGHNRARTRPLANIPLASLKLSLVIFYSFIDVPYLYLFYTSSLVSLIIMSLLIRPDPYGTASQA